MFEYLWTKYLLKITKDVHLSRQQKEKEKEKKKNAVDGGDQGRRVTSVKSDGRENIGNMASPEARSCFHRP